MKITVSLTVPIYVTREIEVSEEALPFIKEWNEKIVSSLSSSDTEELENHDDRSISDFGYQVGMMIESPDSSGSRVQYGEADDFEITFPETVQ